MVYKFSYSKPDFVLFIRVFSPIFSQKLKWKKNPHNQTIAVVKINGGNSFTCGIFATLKSLYNFHSCIHLREKWHHILTRIFPYSVRSAAKIITVSPRTVLFLHNVKYNLHLRRWLRGLHPGLYLHTALYRLKFLRTTWIWNFDLYITGFDNIDPPRNLFTYRQAIAIRFLKLTQEKILTKSNCQKKKVVNETVPM